MYRQSSDLNCLQVFKGTILPDCKPSGYRSCILAIRLSGMFVLLNVAHLYILKDGLIDFFLSNQIQNIAGS